MNVYFFVINFFLECLYLSEYDVRMFLFVFWLRSRPSIKYMHNWGNREGVIQNVYRCVQEKEGGGEKSVVRYVRIKWTPPNVVEYFLCIGSAKYTRAHR